MASTAPATGEWTYQRYLELDDDKRYEVLGGELLMTPAPGTRHQDISSRLFLRLAAFVIEGDRGQVFYAPTDVVLAEDEVVQPDILFIRAQNLGIVGEDAVHGAPDLIVEILSPASLTRDRHQKRELYARSGVPEYWIVDPANRSIEVLALGEHGYDLFSGAAGGTGAVSSRVLDGFAVAVAEAFGGAPAGG